MQFFLPDSERRDIKKLIAGLKEIEREYPGTIPADKLASISRNARDYVVAHHMVNASLALIYASLLVIFARMSQEKMNPAENRGWFISDILLMINSWAFNDVRTNKILRIADDYRDITKYLDRLQNGGRTR